MLFVDGRWVCSHDAIFDSAILEQHYRRYAHDLVSRRYFLVGIDIDFDKFYFAFELVRQGFNRRRDRMAWSAPVCVEIYENRYLGFENFSLELAVVKVHYFAVCLLF